MSDHAARLPDKPSLEQLRKQAKELVRDVRADDEAALGRIRRFINNKSVYDVRLADAQYVIAKEYGFESWPKLVHHIEGMAIDETAHYDDLARAIANAYVSGDFNVIREINWKYGTSFVWERFVEKMQRRLPNWFETRVIDDAIADARELVARGVGFDDWNALQASLAPSQSAGFGAPAPHREAPHPFYRIHNSVIEVRGPLSDKHWDIVIEAIREHDIAGVSAGGMTDVALKRIAELPNIKRLDMESGGLTDDGLLHLEKLPMLEKLNCGGPASRITDKGLAVLRHLKHLKEFQMTWAPQITDHGASNLRYCDELVNVNVMGTRTGDGVIRALAGKQFLTHFSTGAMVTDAGLPCLHDIPVFKTWRGGDEVVDVMSPKARPNHLLLDGPFTNKGFAALDGLNGVAGISFFWHVNNLTSDAFGALGNLPHLIFVGAEGELSGDRAMEHFARIPKLRMLMVQGTVAGDVGFTALSASRTLESIWGRESYNLRNAGFRALATMPSLRNVAMSFLNVDDDALALLPSMPALRELTPMNVQDDAFRHVGRCVNLEKLHCMYCRDTGDSATEYLAGLQHLRLYYAGATKITDRSCDVLARIDSIEELQFWDVPGITDAGIRALATLPALRSIDVEGSPRVTNAGMRVFAPGVRTRLS